MLKLKLHSIILIKYKPTLHCSNRSNFLVRDAFKKKIAEKETLVHSHLTPSLPSLNGTREMGT